MRRLLLVIMVLGLMVGFCQGKSYAVDEWAKAQPAGSANPGDIDTLIGVNNEALDRFMSYGRFNCKLAYASASTLTVGVGSISVANTAGTVRKTRANTSAVTLTWSDLDTGSEAASTTYYVFAVGDTDVATFTIKISTSSSLPSGVTYYKKENKTKEEK